MTLTNDQLDMCLDIARSADTLAHIESALEIEARLVIDAVSSELHRRKHGPFTLAEAVASGQRLRFIGDGEDSPWLDASFFDTHQSNDYLSAARITACNYELEPEGGE